MKTANENLKVSIIIPAFNEKNNIRSCLKSISSQRYKKIEIILVDDCSYDNTLLIAKKVSSSLKLNLKTVRLNKHKERGIARNIGAKASTGDYLFFIDADMKLGKSVIEECIKLVCNDSNVKGIVIPEEPFGEGFWVQCRRLEKRCYLGDERIEAARFFERKAFWKVGGWDDNMISGEDWDLTRRIRTCYKISRIKSLLYHNEYNLTLRKTIKKKFYYGFVSHTYLEKNPLNLSIIFFLIFRPSFIRNWKMIISDPLHGIGMFIIKIVEMSAVGMGYLFSKILNLL